MSALQVWQGALRGPGPRPRRPRAGDPVHRPRRVLDWALDAGDTQAVELLRDVGEAIEPAPCPRRRRVVKRLGDGLMAVFDDPAAAIAAALRGARASAAEIDGHARSCAPACTPGARAGSAATTSASTSNIAARVAAAAGPARSWSPRPCATRLDPEQVASAAWRFKAKGTPKGLKVYAAETFRVTLRE